MSEIRDSKNGSMKQIVNIEQHKGKLKFHAWLVDNAEHR